jgi:hypothetical protein
MDNQRLIFVLLIATVILSISSTIFIFSLNFGTAVNSSVPVEEKTVSSGNVQFVIEENLDNIIIDNETE